MQVITVVSAVFGARCSVLVHDDGSCVVIDAGAGVTDDVLALVEERHLRPAAVLATHGHVDHTWDAGPLSDALGVPVVLHAADVYRLADPFGTLGLLGDCCRHGVVGYGTGRRGLRHWMFTPSMMTSDTGTSVPSTVPASAMACSTSMPVVMWPITV